MKTKRTFRFTLIVVLAALGFHAGAQESGQESEQGSNPGVTIVMNGKEINASPFGGEITIRTVGDKIEIDTDGDGKAEQHIDRPTVTKKIAWLGVKTNDVAPELAFQLDLEGGAVIEMIVPDSPAEKAGLQDYDIITKVGESEIGTPEDLSDAIRALNPGSETSVTVVRKTKAIDFTAALGERPEMPRLERLDLRELDPNGDVGEIRERIEKIQREIIGGMKLRIDDLNLPDLNFPDRGNGADTFRLSSKITSFSDRDGSITIENKNGEIQIEAKDADGKLLYKGPAETEDDRKNLPRKALEMLERFEAMDMDIDMEGFEDKVLPPALDVPKLEPAKPKKPSGTGN